ncbi:hypothetical protein AAOGI_01420 [Agarivorans albus]
MVVIPILTKSMGMESYGVYVTLISAGALLSVLTDFGLSMSVPKETAVNQQCKETISKLISSFVCIKLFLSLIVILLLQAFLYEKAYLHLASLYFFMINMSPLPILQGLEKYVFAAKAQLASKVLLISMVISVDFTEAGIGKALFIQCLVLMLFNLLGYMKLIPAIKGGIDIPYTFELIKKSIGYYFARLLVNIYQQGSTYISSLVLTSESVAVYSIAQQIYKIGVSIIGAVSKVLFTKLANTRDAEILKKTTLFTFIILSVFLPVVFYFGHQIFSLVLGMDAKRLADYCSLLYISLYFVTISSYWGYPALVPIHKENYAHIGIFISALSYFAFLLFVYTLSTLTAIYFVYAIVISDALGALARMFFAKKFKVI